MALSPGTRLGPYAVLAPLGAGGMGEVYRAKDTRLDRSVALKVLPAEVAHDPERRARFEREARTVSSLNHPHICTLYDVGGQDGIDYIVLELIEGETLLDRLKKGPLPLPQALRYAIEIADALDKAHRSGVVHRDLKPGNVMLAKAGTKLMDFGLAKQGSLGARGDLSVLPTQAKPLTEAGSLLGTYQYMAPEQLEGNDADARSDLWALGCVLYEMATGRRAFEGRSQASLIGAILKDEPQPLSKLQPLAPPALARLVLTCLAKDPEDRWQSARDLMRELKWIAEGDAAGAAISLPATRRLPLTWTLAFVAAAAAGGVWLGRRSVPAPAPEGARVARFSVDLPSTEPLSRQRGQLVAVSPDGRWLAVAPGNGPLWVRRMDDPAFRPVRGTDGAYNPFFSPDSTWVGFAAIGRLKKVPLSGGPPVALCEAQALRGAVWGPDGAIWFTPNFRSGLWRVSAGGGDPVNVTRLDEARGEISHRWPELLPGAKALLFTVKTADISSFDEARIDAVDLTTGRRQTLLEGAYHARYAPSGHLVFHRGGSMAAAPFDPVRVRVTGPSVPISDGILADTSGGMAHYDFSRDGLFAYVPGKAGWPERRLVWVDRAGSQQPIQAPPRSYYAVRVSPDGRRLALGVGSANDDLWILDLGRGALTRVTHGGGNHNGPVWSPDGQQLAIGSERGGPWNVFLLPAGGGSREQRLTNDPTPQLPSSFSPDGRSLVFVQSNASTKGDVWVLSLDGAPVARPLLQTPYDERDAMISPDGRFLAYTSDESGRAEVYVRPFSGQGERWQVSTEGGSEPVWGRDGRELFFRLGDAVLAAAIERREGGFRTTTARRLFEGRYLREMDGSSVVSVAYDVSPDSQRFAMIERSEEAIPPQLQVVIHWFDELKRGVATGVAKAP